MAAFAAVCVLVSVLVPWDGGFAAGCCVWADAAGGAVFGAIGLFLAVARWLRRPLVLGAGLAGAVGSGGFSVGLTVVRVPVVAGSVDTDG